MNYLFSLFYHIVAIIVPIISTPYLTRILGADGIGQYSYVASYSMYFFLLGSLGFGVYGRRLIAKHRDDKQTLSIYFWELYFCQILVSVVSIISFTCFAFFEPFGAQYQLCFFIEIINVASVAIDVNFFLEGNETFGRIALRNIAIKILSLVFIFLFIKRGDQVWLYSLILAGSTFLSNLLAWPYVFRHINRVKVKQLKPIRHLFPCFLLFLPTIAAKIYPLLDKTLIGLITKNDAQVGNYSKAQQIVDSCTLFLTSLGVVISPRNSYLFSNGKKDEFISNVMKAFRFVIFLGLPMVVGVISIANVMTPWYLNNNNFTSASLLMIILSITIILCGFRNVYGIQYFVSSGQDKKFVIAVLAGTLTNIGLSIPLIYIIGNYGAAVASVLSELLICFLMGIFARKEIHFLQIVRQSWKYFVSTIAMSLICIPLGFSFEPTILNTLIIIAIGVFVYFGFLFIFKDHFILITLDTIEAKLKAIKSDSFLVKYKKFLFYFFVVLISLTALCYSPIFRKIHMNSYIFVLWIVYTFFILFVSYKKIIELVPIAVALIFPFLVFACSYTAFLEKNIILGELSKEILIALYILFIGFLSSSFLNYKQIKVAMIVFYIANIFMALDLLVEYFIGFDFSEVTYVYSEKNSIAPLFAIASVLPFIYSPKKNGIKAITILGSCFLIIMVALLKCRAVLIVLPVLAIYLSFNPKYKKYIPFLVVGLMAVATIVVIAIPSLRELIINNILFANRNPDNLDDISSGRLTYIFNGLNVFSLAPFTGIGFYYIDFAPLELLISYGLIGFILLLPLFVFPIIIYLKNKKNIGIELSMLIACIIIIIYINSLFEAYSPFGPGIRAYLLWFFSGHVLYEWIAQNNIKKKMVFNSNIETMVIEI